MKVETHELAAEEPIVKYDFDREVSRKDTNSVKWEFIQRGKDLLKWEHTDEFYGDDRIIPMWVADMDFACPDPVIKALINRAKHGIYGYAAPTDLYLQSVVNWMKKRHGWEISPPWICITPGVVPALNMLVQTFISPGEKVLIQPPVYYPFYGAIENNGGELVTNPLVYENGRYRMDFTHLERVAQDPGLKMAILCSPHNPVGRVWTRDELLRFGEICFQNDVLVISDEIHSDLIYPGQVFTPFSCVKADFEQNSITCTAASKTFNLAGLHTSNIIIPNEKLRTRFMKTIQSNGLFGVNTFGVVALQAAYDHGEEWLDQVMDYIVGNFRFLNEYMDHHLPQIKVIQPEGTYLVWLDCRKLGLDKWGLKKLMLEEAKVYLDEGYIFGPEGEGFERINIACPRGLLVEALDRMRTVIEKNVLN